MAYVFTPARSKATLSHYPLLEYLELYAVTAEGPSRLAPVALHRLAVRYNIPRESAFSFERLNHDKGARGR
jgi:hypothetical protein